VKTMNKTIHGGLLILCAALLSGCFATQRDILDLSQQTDSMTLKIHNLNKIMRELQANQADLNVRTEELQRSVSMLNENLKDNHDSMSRLSSKMDDLGAAIGMKVSSLGQTIGKSQAAIDRKLERTDQRLNEEASRRARLEAELKKKKEEESRARSEAEAAATGPTPSQIYHSARIQMGKKEYELAAEGFKVYLEKYPKGEVADLATYYLGQARYAQKRWEDAARQFALVLDRFPKSDVTPSARLRYALCLLQMKSHLDEAKRYLQSIPADFPGTAEAQKARGLLEEWDTKAKASQEKGQ